VINNAAGRYCGGAGRFEAGQHRLNVAYDAAVLMAVAWGPSSAFHDTHCHQSKRTGDGGRAAISWWDYWRPGFAVIDSSVTVVAVQ